MTNQSQLARKELLESGEISDSDLERLLGSLMSRNIDIGELYFEHSRHESFGVEAGLVRNADFGVNRGVGVRAISGEKTGFAYSDEIALPSLQSATQAARSIARHGQNQSVVTGVERLNSALYSSDDPILSVSETEKVGLLSRIDKFTRALDPCVKEVQITLSASQNTTYVFSSDGMRVGDIRPLVRFGVSVIVERNGRRETGHAGGGGRFDLKWILGENVPEDYAREAVRVAMINLDAIDAPAGPMTVVLGPGWPGVLLHEAVGHGLEADFNRKGTSAFTGRMGEQVASPLCTIVDDATIAGRRGSLTVDDEGTPGQRTVLIENGILKGYMQDKLNARLMGGRSTGNGRRESFNCLPMPRMTNTFMLNGASEPDEIIQSVKKGVYAVSFGGGQVDITSGQFTFSATEAYLIENGKISSPIRGATLVGNGPEIMSRISMVGNDLRLDPGIGVCGKEGQEVPVGVGQPTLKVDEITMGGTSS